MIEITGSGSAGSPPASAATWERRNAVDENEGAGTPSTRPRARARRRRPRARTHRDGRSFRVRRRRCGPDPNVAEISTAWPGPRPLDVAHKETRTSKAPAVLPPGRARARVPRGLCAPRPRGSTRWTPRGRRSPARRTSAAPRRAPPASSRRRLRGRFYEKRLDEAAGGRVSRKGTPAASTTLFEEKGRRRRALERARELRFRRVGRFLETPAPEAVVAVVGPEARGAPVQTARRRQLDLDRGRAPRAEHLAARDARDGVGALRRREQLLAQRRVGVPGPRLDDAVHRIVERRLEAVLLEVGLDGRALVFQVLVAHGP